jgi:iron complex outermembrane receptor protein
MLIVLRGLLRLSSHCAALTALIALSVGFHAFGASQVTAQTTGTAPTELPPIEVKTTGEKGPKPKKGTTGKSSRPSALSPEPPPLPPSDPAADLGFYNPALDLRDIELPPETTLTTAGPVSGYRALTAVSATKTATPLDDLPQSIQVIPQSVIRDQGNVSLSEAIQNVSGVVGTNRVRTPGYDFITIRGFEAEQWLDGLSVLYNIGNRDALANIERIEVLKGPNAILYGGGNGAPIGGAVNVISKLPTNVASGEFGVTFGSEDYARPYFDINQPIARDGTALFRLTGEYTSTESFIETLEAESYSINPTLTLTDKTETSLTIQGRITHWSQQEYQGLPAVGTVAGVFDIKRTLFIGPPDVPDSTTEIQGITTSLDHKIDDHFGIHAKARWSEATFRQLGQLLFGSDGFRANEPVGPPSTWLLTNTILDQGQKEFTVSANVDAKFTAGPTRNVLLLGADHSHIADQGYIASDLAFGGAGLIDLQAPLFPAPYVTPIATLAASEKEFVNEGLYVQIQSSIADRLHLLGGLRLAHVDISSTNRIDGALDETSETKLLPKVGGLLEIDQHISVYASFSRGLKGQPLISHNGAPAPEQSEQAEAGIKFQVGELTGTAAAFEINRSNIPVLDGFITVDTSKERSRGFETDIIWQPTPHWRLIGSYAFIDATLVEPTTGGSAGNRLVGVPEHSGRLWVHHDFEPEALKGWSFGAGIYAASRQAIEISNAYLSDSYFTIDARLGYDTSAFSAGLSIKNLTDEEYFIPFDFFRGRVAPGEPRTVYGSIAYRY